MISDRERLVQLARLVGVDDFVHRFGLPQAAAPELGALRNLIDERVDHIVSALVGEAAASDDVTSGWGALAYLDDRLRAFADILTQAQATQIRDSFAEKTAGW